MSNAQKTKAFLSVTDAAVRAKILTNIANHYGITPTEAYEEVTDDVMSEILEKHDHTLQRVAAVILNARLVAGCLGRSTVEFDKLERDFSQLRGDLTRVAINAARVDTGDMTPGAGA